MSTNQKDESLSKLQADINYRDLFDLRGKVAVVTGGAGILGQHFCRALAESGADLAVLDLKSDKASDVAKNISERHGVKVIGYGCDVSDPSSVQRTVQEVIEEFGEINSLHNNAAGKSSDLDAFFASLEEYS